MKIKSTREQNEIKDICLKERLELIVPKVLKESKADMWIVASKEYHEDLVFDSLTPASYLTARRITMLVFVKAGNGCYHHLVLNTSFKRRFWLTRPP